MFLKMAAGVVAIATASVVQTNHHLNIDSLSCDNVVNDDMRLNCLR